jgi:hypothetical protein
MKIRFLAFLIMISTLSFLVTPVWAYTVLYDNELTNFTLGGYAITPQSEVSDSFTLADTSTLTMVQIGIWVEPGIVPYTVDWEIGSTPFGNTFNGTAVLTNTSAGIGANPQGIYDLYESTFTVNLPLDAGMYWLTLQNATDTITPLIIDNPIWWDVSFGPSLAYDKMLGAVSKYSLSFEIYGPANSAVPIPPALLLLGSGLVGLAGLRKRFIKK